MSPKSQEQEEEKKPHLELIKQLHFIHTHTLHTETRLRGYPIRNSKRTKHDAFLTYLPSFASDFFPVCPQLV